MIFKTGKRLDIDSNFVPILIITLVLVIFLSTAIRIAREDQRFVVFRLGRFLGLKGPGLILMILGVDRLHKLSIGDTGTLIASGQARFDDVVVSVKGDDGKSIDSFVRIRGFTDNAVLIMASPNQGPHNQVHTR